MTRPAVTIRQIALTGPNVTPAVVTFRDGLNVVYGASNTGKSFTVKAIDIMLGSESALPNPKIRHGYDAGWLGLEMRDGRKLTLYRAAQGGEFLSYDGIVYSGGGGHSADVNDIILGASSLHGKQVVANKDGRKQSMTIRTLMPYLVVSETAIIEERSPILTGNHAGASAEKSIFRVLLTGVDDSAVATMVPRKTHKVRIDAKIELVADLIASIERKLGDRVRQEDALQEQIARLQATIDALAQRLQGAQDEIDQATRARRLLLDRRLESTARARELDITIGRFQWLLKSYESDIERLQALNEAGSLLTARAGRPCSLCGAGTEHQSHDYTASSIEQMTIAAAAELRRIQRDRRDLEATIVALTTELGGIRDVVDTLRAEVLQTDEALAGLRPQETALRTEFEAKWSLRNELQEVLRQFAERRDLQQRKADLEAESKRKVTTNAQITVGVDGSTAHAFANVVQEVLEAWKFPGTPTVTFDDKNQDIRLDGEDRKDNGKGVRAILHAAFKVGLLIYCQKKGLPHPGFIILDTPLLTYRDPITSRYGVLDEDEKRLKATPLNEAFYAHLGSLGDVAQIIVMENTDPPSAVLDRAQVFEGPGGATRVGFFPPRQ